jgi:hypothetical protein
MFYVYIYRDPSRKNEPIYVGKGTGRRAYKHLTRKDKHPFTHRLQLMKREGVEPHIEIINAIDEDHAFFMEECCIQVLGRKDLRTGSLLNLNDGGKGGMSGWVASVETRKTWSEARKGKSLSAEARRRMSDAQKGKSFSAEHRQRMSDALKGRVHPKVICPHCGKEGGASALKRYHFDNCKFKP